MTSKEKKQILNNFIETENRVKELEQELEKLWSRATSTSPNLDGLPRGSGGVDKIQSAVERIEKLVKLIDDERDELAAVQYRIMSAIRKLPDITERRIIHLKYIGEADSKYHRTMPLWKIANELGYSHDRIRHIHSAAILHLEL